MAATKYTGTTADDLLAQAAETELVQAVREHEHKELTRAKRLAIAAAVAPSVRTENRRKVKTYNQETGAITGEVTLHEVTDSLLLAHEIEIAKLPGEVPDEKMCEACGLPFRPASLNANDKWCVKCRVVKCLDCGEALNASARSQGTVRCKPCAGKEKKPLPKCLDCSKELSSSARSQGTVRCYPCAAKHRRKSRPKCLDCSKGLSRGARSMGTVRCHPCAMKFSHAKRRAAAGGK